MDTLNHVSIIQRHLVNYFDQTTDNLLELDIENLDLEISIQERVLSQYEELYEAAKSTLETEEELDLSFMESIKDVIDSVRKKSEILQSYLGVMDTHEFAINKLADENESYIKEIWTKLKSYADSGKVVSSDLESLKQMEEECAELVKKKNSLMAPSH